MLIMLDKVVLPFESMDEILKCDHSNYSFCSMVFCSNVDYAIMLHNVVLPFESMDKILKCDHSNYSFCSVVFCSNVDSVAQSGSYL